MTALATERNTPRRDGVALNLPTAASKTFYAGGLAMVNASGYATPGATATGCRGAGVCRQTVTSGAVAGVERVDVETGVFRFANSASGDAITLAAFGQTVYIVDDQTVALTNGSSSRSPAGTVVDVDNLGVWVRVGA